MTTMKLAANLIDVTVLASHLQLVYNDIELEVQAPDEFEFPPVWHYPGKRQHSLDTDDRHFTPNYGVEGKYVSVDLDLGDADPALIWNTLNAIYDVFASEGTSISYTLFQNSNSFINTLLYMVGIDLSDLIESVAPADAPNFPGWETNVLTNGAVDFGFDLDLTAGCDFLRTGQGDDIVRAGEGDDTVESFEGDDSLYGGEGADSLDGGDGGDILYGGEGADILRGGDGDDFLFANGGTGLEFIGAGDERIFDPNFADGKPSAASYADGETDYLFGGEGNDSYFVGSRDGFEDFDVIRDTDGVGQIWHGWGYYGSPVFFMDAEVRDHVVNGSYEYYKLSIGELEVVFHTDEATGISFNRLVYVWEVPHFAIDGFFNGSFGLFLEGFQSVFVGDERDNVIEGTYGDDQIDAGGGNDVINGLKGDDTIDAGDGDDTVNGGEGVDVMNGGAGSDRYEYARGDGHDTISDPGSGQAGDEEDTLVFSDINPGDVTLVRQDAGVTLMIGESAPGRDDGGSIWLDDDLDAGSDVVFAPFVLAEDGAATASDPVSGAGAGLERVVFADGSEWSIDTIKRTLVDQAGTDDDDVILGFNSMDDRLVGRAGDDWLDGQAGNDRYMYSQGDGHDTIWDGGSGGATAGDDDQLIFSRIPSYRVQAVRENNYDVRFIVGESRPGAGDGGSVLVIDQLRDEGDMGVERIVFGDRRSWSRDDLRDALSAEIATGGDDLIRFSGTTEGFVDAGAGTDTLRFDPDLAEFELGGAGDEYTLTHNATGDTVQFTNVEYLTFNDATDISLDDLVANSNHAPGDTWYDPEPIGGLI